MSHDKEFNPQAQNFLPSNNNQLMANQVGSSTGGQEPGFEGTALTGALTTLNQAVTQQVEFFYDTHRHSLNVC